MRVIRGLAVLWCVLWCEVASAAPGAYGACSSAVDPPTCLVALAIRDEKRDAHVLESLIMAGATGAIEQHAARLTRAVQNDVNASNPFAEAAGIELPANPAVEQASGADGSVALAAVALATAAHAHDDPFNEPITQKLIAVAGNHPAIAQLAVTLWSKADTYSEWNGDNPNTRPRGMSAIWRAVIARPPARSDVLAEIANSASADGYDTEGLALLKIAAARRDLSNETRAHIASQFARWHRMPDEAQRAMDEGGAKAEGYSIDGITVSIARARLYHGYDAKAASVVTDDCLKGLSQQAFHSYLGQENLSALEAGKALRELLSLGDAYLVRARQANKSPEDQGEWFALASEAFRRGGDKAKAVAAAREGIAYVAPAVSARNSGLSTPVTDKRAAAVNANGYGTAPVVALYRASARDEAVGTGFLTGYDRYKNAEIAGEQPDPRWVLEDKSSFYIEILERHLIWRDDVKGGQSFYEGLRCSSVYGANRQDELHSLLGTLAALIGRRSSMTAHFERVATRKSSAYFALNLAADWRRGLVIADRKSAHADSFADAACR